METNKTIKEIYEIACPKCGKIISSISENQFNYNIKQHMDSHARKIGKKDDKHNKK